QVQRRRFFVPPSVESAVAAFQGRQVWPPERLTEPTTRDRARACVGRARAARRRWWGQAVSLAGLLVAALLAGAWDRGRDHAAARFDDLAAFRADNPQDERAAERLA